MSLLKDLFSSMIAKPPSSNKEVIRLSGDDTFDIDITGEEGFQAALEDLGGPRLPEGVHQVETARLVVTNNGTGSNRNAVRVEIRGQLVGYLSVADTLQYRHYLYTKGKPKAHGLCYALIKGGWVTPDGTKGPYYVALDITALAH
jgi:hypothetical protein